MLHLVGLILALSGGNGNMIHLKCLHVQSAFYPQSAYFILGLQSVCYQSAFYSSIGSLNSVVHSLSFTH